MADLIDRIAGTDATRPKINLHRFMGAERLYALGEWSRSQIATEFDLQGNEATQAGQIADVIDGLWALNSHAFNTVNVTLTNIPVAVTEFAGNAHRRMSINFAQVGQVRLSVRVSTAGNSTAVLYAQYTTNETDWVTLTGNQVSLATPIGTKVSAWESVPSGARVGDVIVRIVTSGGDAAADPVVGSVHLQVKNFLDRAIYVMRVESVCMCLEDGTDRLYHDAGGALNRAKIYEDLLISG